MTFENEHSIASKVAAYNAIINDFRKATDIGDSSTPVKGVGNCIGSTRVQIPAGVFHWHVFV